MLAKYVSLWLLAEGIVILSGEMTKQFLWNYIPFFVENTELHIGPRPKNSIYSGGNTAWQDSEEKEKGLNRRLPKLWYGWFGSGNQSNWKINLDLKKFIKKIIKKFKR